MSWKAEVVADNSGVFVPNALRFATKEEALAYANDLAGRWTMVRNYRAIEDKARVNYRWNGKLEHIPIEDLP